MSWSVVVAVFAVALVGAAPLLRAATATDFLYATLPKTGAEPNDLPYRYLVPAGYDAAQHYPLIVFLHGSGERGSNNTAQLNNNANGALQLVSTANQAIIPCFMLAPQASVVEGWNANTLNQVVRAITRMEADYSIDPNRVYVTGLSMGGAGTWEILTRYPFLFAAAVPMNGWGAGSYAKIVGVPVWSFHAVDDGSVGVAGSDNAISALRQAGGRAIYTRYATGGHFIWPTAYSNPYLRPWLLAQRRNQPMAGAPIVSIASPLPPIIPPPIVPARSVNGTAFIPGGVTQVNWTFTPWVGGAGVDTSTYALATGTDSWTVTDAPVAGNSTLFLAIATGPSWATGTGGNTGGGVTTLNDFFWNVPTGADLSAPSVAITAPVGTGVLETTSSLLTMAGTAGATGGKAVKAISWRNDRGGEGFGVGTTAWSIVDVDLQPGDNLLTVTVRDSSSITATTTLLVHAQFGGFAGWRLTEFTGADQTDEAVSGPLADPDVDGLPNLLEYAFGTSPSQAQSGAAPLGALEAGEAGAVVLTLVHRNRLGAAVVVAYETSADLVNWSEVVVTRVVENPDVDGDGRTALVRASLAVDPGDTRRFLRLRVSLP
ncbi:MAG: prolyl oligopeptidase family serine peptidase [Opitutaceae bacterium]|nr:prolyl oligopeptidase family serine peptidase [Opitutaceae bacterium]